MNAFFEQWKSTNFQPSDRVLSLSFFEKRVKSVYWGLSKAEERFCWEQWFVTISIDTSAQITSPMIHLALSKSLRSNITKILRIANEEFGHVPPLVNQETTPFPYEIKLEDNQSEDGLLGTKFKLWT